MSIQDDFVELTRSARTFRRFVQHERIAPETLAALVDCARFVPSASNKQPLRYRLVHEPAECAAVFAHLKWAGALKDWPGPAEGERPAAYIVMLAETGQNPAVDTGIAAQTINLYARAMGYGMCMLGAIDRPAIHAELRLPAELAVQLVLALGHPAERVVIEELPASGNTVYWRTPDSVHHVPKRALKDVVV